VPARPFGTGNAYAWDLFYAVGRAACEACSATWNLATESAFALGPVKTTAKLD
jgi:hypothetical protein